MPNAKDPTRETARGVVLSVAEAIKLADRVCAQVALEQRRGAVAAECADAYDRARKAELVAANAIDAWDAGAQGKTACAVLGAAKALEQMSVALAAMGVVMPAAIVDALKLAPVIGGVCRG